MTFNAGDALTVPAGAVHAVRNVRSGNAAEPATYVTGKGKPLITLAEGAPARRYNRPLFAPPSRKGEESSRRRTA